MAEFVLSVLIVLLVVAGMAVGVIFGRPPMKGSCGGMGALGVDTACDICGGNPARCDEETRDGEYGGKDSARFYSADQ